MKNSNRIVLAILIIALMLAPRIARLAEFTAADEPFWLVVSANYYYALTHHEFANTVYEYHPAVTTMSIGTAAMLVYFPEYRAIMHGYFQQEKTSFDTYLVEHNRDPLRLLWWARFFQVMLNVFLLVVVFLLLRFMLDEWTALLVVLLASFAPYLFGQSRMLNHESMVALFSLIALLAMTAYLFRDRKAGLLILSGCAAAFANLTKSSSLFLLPVILVVITVWVISTWRTQHWSAVRFAAAIFLIWFGVLVLTYFIVWPGMWVAPGKMLYEVYGNAFSYAFEGSRLSVTNEVTPTAINPEAVLASFWKILISIAWRTTPITWLGLLFSVLFILNRKYESLPALAKSLIAFLFLQAAACVALFSVAHGRDQPHYVLSSYYALEIAAGLGWAYGLRWLSQSFSWAARASAQISVFAALLVAQAYPLLYSAPYYYTYLNPIMLANAPAPQFPYGEVMEQAAAYLAQKTDAQNQTALVYFGRSFSYYYPGKTLLFKPVLFEDKAHLVENLRMSDYLVVYSGVHGRLPLLQQLTPQRVLYLNGMPYVEIYRVADIPAEFYDQ